MLHVTADFACAGALVPDAQPDIAVELSKAPLPLRLRLEGVRARAPRVPVHTRPRLPSLPFAARAVPAVGATAFTMALLRDRRRGPR